MNNNIVSKGGVRALIMSDLHLEYEPWAGVRKPGGSLPLRPPATSFDLIILAGDISTAGDRHHETNKFVPELYCRLLDYLEELNSYNKPILFVNGNHEYYYSSNFGNLKESLSQRLEAPAYSNIHLLDRSAFEYQGITFIGATLWTDFDNKNKDEMAKAKIKMSDYDVIAPPKPPPDEKHYKITPQNVYDEHYSDLLYITEQLENSSAKNCVVITHHAPVEHHELSLDLPSAYQSDLSSVISKLKPLAWVHGHIHQSIDKTVVDTRILCNPRGYIAHKRKNSNGNIVEEPARLNPNFKPDFIVNFNIQGK
ncbi:metallophosphoesterase [Thalassotalea castellviae]|uniref:Metallophosphoesterase n=1 Tax=Thalassotalea castellviae TaxID=3075612 RepID=A0ABU3A2X1_9GAMM|nr:metallophosphoesterase [Thalassotalea sp. W431]MDT0604319.1 metallophosphoesterase [Thalassotalea sp. W431]